MPPKKKGKRNSANKKGSDAIQFKDPADGTEYARILKPLGNCRFLCRTTGCEELQASLCGRIKKGPRIVPGDIVLVSRRDWQVIHHLDIIYKYTKAQSEKLKSYGELNDIPEEVGNDTFNDDVIFTDDPDQFGVIDVDDI